MFDYARRSNVNDENPDRTMDDGAWNTPAAMSVEAAFDEGGEEYLLNDIGVALRLLSERG
jgi:hypothetical protein